MSTEVKIRAMDDVLPTALITRMKNDEKAMMAAATLVFNLTLETIHYVGNKLPKRLDAYPGDLNCQGRVTLLPELVEKKEVCQELRGLAEKIKVKMQVLKDRRREQNCSCSEFYEKEIATLEVSSDVRYLMDCRLLTITRATQYVKPNGMIMSMTDHGRLSVLSPKFHEIENRTLGNNFREQITQNVSTRISAETMVRLQDLSRRRKIPEQLQRMISQVVVFKPENYPPKTFGCSCFTLQLALLELLEKKISLAIKTIVTKGEEPRLIFFKAQENDFEFQELNEARQLPKTVFVAICLAVVP